MAWFIMTGEGDSAHYYANEARFEGDLLIMKDVYRTDCYTNYFTHYPGYVVRGTRYRASERIGRWFKKDNSAQGPELKKG